MQLIKTVMTFCFSDVSSISALDEIEGNDAAEPEEAQDHISFELLKDRPCENIMDDSYMK